MTHQIWIIAVTVSLATVSATAASPGTLRPAQGGATLVQDFEGPVEIGTWPETGRTQTSTAWAADGMRSLAIMPGTHASVSTLKVTDWSGYQIWRMHVNVPGEHGAVLGLELADVAGSKAFHDRHQNSAAAPPGISTVDVDIAGDIWRGEVNRPYRLLKTPVDKHHMVRIAIASETATVYVDRIELIRESPLTTPGGFAFDFGPPRSPVQRQWTGVTPADAWDAARGYGFTGGNTRGMVKTTPYPTRMMGDGLIFGDASFQVRLPGGPYRGWAVFDRSGFWEGEQAAYAKLTLLTNGRAVHTHTADPAAAYFQLQDVEALTGADIADRMVFPRQGEATFAFKATKGSNTIALNIEGLKGDAPRLAGLVLAPDTAAGRAFLAAHRTLQRDTIMATHMVVDRARREADPSVGEVDLKVLQLPPEAAVCPGDWPAQPGGIRALRGFAGTTLHLVLGVYARDALNLSAAIEPGSGALPAGAITIQAGRYLPARDYETSACWIETHHYRPFDAVKVGPGLARALLVTVAIPAGTAAGDHAATLVLPFGGKNVARIPLRIQVLPGTLPALDFPTGLFFSAIPVPRSLLPDDATYWRLTGQLLDLLARAGRTCLTAGPDYSLTWKGSTAVWEGADALRVIRMARERGPVLAVVNYGGFDRGLRDFKPPDGMDRMVALKEAGRAWSEFEQANHLPPHYVSTYDEPGVEEDFIPIWPRLEGLNAAGMRTLGFTSINDPTKADANHLRLLKESFAPAFNGHTPATLAAVATLGHEPWVYNNGLGRFDQGVHQWRNRKAGMVGRLDWIGAIVQGFQFDALDSREPDPSCFYVHSKLGVLVSPRFVGLCEGTLDARLLCELERRLAGFGPASWGRRTQGGRPAHSAGMAAGRGDWVKQARTLLDGLLARPYRKTMPDAELNALRDSVLDLLEASAH